MCPELLLNLVVILMERVDYWKMKGQAADAESAVETYPSGRCGAAG
jgi:hypothetical protein